jgi:ABC-type glycerol-3-phosphate transport system substrate-binding protein
MATDTQGGSALANIVGALPTNKVAISKITDPITKFFLSTAAHPQIPLLDSVVPLKIALLYYQQLQAAFALKTPPAQAMQNVDKGIKTLNP